MALVYSQKTQQALELVTGLIVLVIFAVAVVMAIVGRGQKHTGGYPLHASFNQVDGLDIGSDVKLAGVSIGQVVQETVDPGEFRAVVTFTVRSDIHLPVDTAAVITSDSLLGGKYIDLSPGGDENTLQPGQFVTHTQGSISLQQLLSKFIFSVTDSMSKSGKNGSERSDNPVHDQPLQ